MLEIVQLTPLGQGSGVAQFNHSGAFRTQLAGRWHPRKSTDASLIAAENNQAKLKTQERARKRKNAQERER